ncbi:hypothetical protein LguiA_024359 [Lonicera macranthoides]
MKSFEKGITASSPPPAMIVDLTSESCESQLDFGYHFDGYNAYHHLVIKSQITTVIRRRLFANLFARVYEKWFTVLIKIEHMSYVELIKKTNMNII